MRSRAGVASESASPSSAGRGAPRRTPVSSKPGQAGDPPADRVPAFAKQRTARRRSRVPARTTASPMWTAVVGAAIFAAARGSRIRLLWVLGAYLLVSGLHATFDSINSVGGYVIVSIVGLIPLVWLWLRADGAGRIAPPQTMEIEAAR